MLDLHTHHDRCGHAIGALHAYAEAALRRGVQILGVSDHAPLLLAGGPDDPAPGMHMPRSAFSGYLDDAVALRERYAGRLDVLVGVEADFLPAREGAYATLLADPRLDYALGAVHYLDGFHVYDRRRWTHATDVDALYESYLEQVQIAAATGLYDVMAHIDAIKGRAPRRPRHPERSWDATVAALSAADVAVEINTSGYRKCGEPFPAWGLIERLHEAGVPLTFGSDAHAPDEVHYGWSDVYAGLRARGIEQVVIVRGRRRQTMALQDVVARR